MFRFFSLALAFLLLDQSTKYAAEIFLAPLGSVPVLNGVFHLTLVHNRGAAFGILKGGGFFFIAVSFFCLALIAALVTSKPLFEKLLGREFQDRSVRLSLALIFGGACGNLIDRLRYSYVIDFLDFRVWPVFNIADSCITVGGFLLFFRMITKSNPATSR